MFNIKVGGKGVPSVVGTGRHCISALNKKPLLLPQPGQPGEIEKERVSIL